MRLVAVQLPHWSPDGAANFGHAQDLLGDSPEAGSLIVLPELIGADLAEAAYQGHVTELAHKTSSWVVGGSHYLHTASGKLNAGVVADPTGRIVAAYSKRHPFGPEVGQVIAGQGGAMFDLGGLDVLVMICADVLYPDSFRDLPSRPTILAAPIFSLTSRDSPHSARRIWSSFAVTRSFELGALVVTSDWTPTAHFAGRPSAGAAGFVHPTPAHPDGLFQPLGSDPIGHFVADRDSLTALDAFRRRTRFTTVSPQADQLSPCQPA